MPTCVHQINHGCVPKLVFCYAYGSAVSLMVVAEGGNSAELCWEILAMTDCRYQGFRMQYYGER